MARYRLRFLLQEFDLPPGDTLIGRGPDCRITLVDPLVSRHHARVRIETARATIEDLGSRNGSRVNARLIRGAHPLKDGDRIRIGTQELVFSEIDSVQLATNKQTGFLCHCSGCRLPYPEELGACPNCGSREVEEENTLSGILDDRGRQNWALQMLIEMLRKALTLGRESDADRILHQAMTSVDERLRSPDHIEASQLEALSLEALKLSNIQGTAAWAKWVLETYRKSARLPPRSVVESVSRLPASELLTLRDQLDDLVACAPINKLSPGEVEGLARLKTIRATLHGG
ncbi:MAG TPA: FHA domain-containing protein [Polyangiaceae bacterium]